MHNDTSDFPKIETDGGPLGERREPTPVIGAQPHPASVDLEMGQHHPLQVLLVEDNLVNQKVAMGILSRIGYRADVAANGLEALGALREQPYDVVLMDIQMPEMDGLEATRRIREEWPLEQQPYIIALTANAMRGNRTTYLAAGMDDFVSKPAQIDKLVQALGKCQPLSSRIHKAPTLAETPSRPLQAESTDEADFDWSMINDFQEMLGEDGPEMILELITIFLEEVPTQLAALQAGVARQDARSIRQAAHSLKSSSANLGAVGLSALCQELETMGRQGILTGTVEKVAQAQSEYARVKTILQRPKLGHNE